MEYYDVLTADRQPTGRVRMRGEALGEGEYRSGAEIWVFVPDGRLMVTQRHPEKDEYPLLWECTGGLVRSGESTFETIKREAAEEIGVKFEDDEIRFVTTILRNRQFLDVYTAVTDKTVFSLQPDEVVDYRFVTDDELKAMYEKGEFISFIYERVSQHIAEARRINSIV